MPARPFIVSKLGAGTASPAVAVHAYGDAYCNVRAEGTSAAGMQVGDLNATSGRRNFDIRSDGGILKIGSASDNWAAYVNDGILAVTYDAKVGIGTTSPAVMFDVRGNVRFGSAAAASSLDIGYDMANTAGYVSNLNLYGYQSGGNRYGGIASGAFNSLTGFHVGMIGTGSGGTLFNNFYNWIYGGGWFLHERSKTGNPELMRIVAVDDGGGTWRANMALGTTDTATYRLNVNGKIRANDYYSNDGSVGGTFNYVVEDPENPGDFYLHVVKNGLLISRTLVV